MISYGIHFVVTLAVLTEALAVSDVVWARGLLKKGVGLCHGISGNAYLFLYLYRVMNLFTCVGVYLTYSSMLLQATQEMKFLYRAWSFAEFSMSEQCASKTWDKPDEVRESTSSLSILTNTIACT